MIPFSVEVTLTLAFMLQKSCGARVRGWGFSTSFKSPVQTQNSEIGIKFKNMQQILND